MINVYLLRRERSGAQCNGFPTWRCGGGGDQGPVSEQRTTPDHGSARATRVGCCPRHIYRAYLDERRFWAVCFELVHLKNSLVILTWYHLIYTLWVTLYWAYWIKNGYAFFVLVPLFTCLVRVLYCHSFLFKRKVFHNESSTITTLILYLDSQFHPAALFLRRHFSYRIEHTLQMFEDVERHDQIYFRWVPSSEQRKKTANNGEMVIV